MSNAIVTNETVTAVTAVDAIDAFRHTFFQNLIDEEKKKEAALKLQQANCFHKYLAQNELEKVCSKCSHVQRVRSVGNKFHLPKPKSDCAIS